MRLPALVLAALTVLAFVAAAAALAAHVDSARLLTHTVGVFAVLAELLRHGVLYPHEPTTELVYSVFYHPLGFAPYALLPGSGLDLIPGMRVVVGVELLACLAVVVWLTRGLPWPQRATPALLALCTVPVCFSLVGMRDDPRAALCALLALAAFGGEGGRRARPALSGLLLAVAFFVKATAPLAPAAALLWAAAREGEGAGARRAAALLGAAFAATVAGILFLQVGLGCDFLHQGLYWIVVDPAREPRAFGAALGALARDVFTWYPGAQPPDYALPAVLGVSAGALVLRVVRRRFDHVDVLVVAAWLKTLAAYRSHGTDLNHLLDLALFAALHVGRALAGWLTPVRALCTVLIALGLGQPWRRLVPEPGTPTIAESPLAAAAAGLRALPPANTLCEEPLLAWLTGSGPLLTDPFLTFAALEDHPEIRACWFGPTDHPAAVQRLVLMYDPFDTAPHVERWYRHLHFDAEFLAMVRRDWRTVLVTDTATVLVRRD